MTSGASNTVVIGIGNLFRRDDGAGIVLARRLRDHAPAGVTIIEASGEGAALLDAWQGAGTVILVDAVHSGAAPGMIHRLDARAERMPREFFRCSTHAFGVAEAVELGRVLNQLPPRLILYGIEGADFSAGDGLSPEARRAVAALAEQVLEELSVPLHP